MTDKPGVTEVTDCIHNATCIITTKDHLMVHIRNNIPAIVKYDMINILPTRSDFIDSTETNKLIDAKKPLIFMPNDVVESTEYDFNYHINIFGVLQCGMKACVKLTNIPIYVDIRLTEPISKIKAKMMDLNIEFKSVEIIKMYPLHGFMIEPVDYARIAFKTLNVRRKFIEAFGNYELSSDDLGAQRAYYFALVARTHKFNTAYWCMFDTYKTVRNATKCIQFEVDVNNYKKISKEVKASHGSYINNDKTMVRSWDIETRGHNPNGAVPTIEDKYSAFMINSSYFWHYDNIPIVNYCAVYPSCIPRVGVCVVCNSLEEVCAANMYIYAFMSADICGAFNGGCFDWPLVREDMKRYKLPGSAGGGKTILEMVLHTCSQLNNHKETADAVYKWTFPSTKIKITAEREHILTCAARIPGCLDIDTMPVFLQLYPKTEVGRSKSLNFFLKANGLELKEDMEFKRMFKIYDKAVSNFEAGVNDPEVDRLMGEVAYYCTIDCIRPHQLCVKRNVIREKRAFANMTYIPLRDAFFKADGMRVQNVVSTYCYHAKVEGKYSLAVSNRYKEVPNCLKEHYPGGWVFEPKLGMSKHPVSSFDFASLYPSIMIAYNITPDMIVYDEEYAKELLRLGYPVEQIGPFEYEIGEKKGVSSNKKCTGTCWFVRHEFSWPDNTKPLPGQRMGIFPTILKKLFDKRVPIKDEMFRLYKVLETMSKNNLTEIEETIEEITKMWTYDEVVFMRTKIESKQKAIKLLSNTFYGGTGSFRSPLYSLFVAAGVTTYGQKNTKGVAKYVETQGFDILYGDTDSIYITCPSKLAFLDEKYLPLIESLSGPEKYAMRKEYWTCLVDETMKCANILAAGIKEFVVNFTKTRFLGMTLESINFPFWSCGKKKYCMIPHIKSTNFNNDIDIMGIDIIKQGQAGITKKLVNEYITQVMSVENDRSLFDVCIDYIHQIYKEALEPELFKLTASYKPNKHNVPVLKFIERMTAIKKLNPNVNFELPEPGDKFDYIVVKKVQSWDLRGRKIEIKKGDKMEFLSMFDSNTMEIDLEYYISGALLGVFASLIASTDMFKPTYTNIPFKEYYKEIVGNAKKYLEGLCATLSGVNKQISKDTGLKYRKVYKEIEKSALSALDDKIKNIVLDDSIDVTPMVRIDVCRHVDVLSANMPSIYALHRFYGWYSKIKLEYLNNIIFKQKSWLRDYSGDVKSIINGYNRRLEEAVMQVRDVNGETVVENVVTFMEDEETLLKEFHATRDKLQVYTNMKQEVLDAWKLIEDRRRNVMTIVPNSMDVKVMAREDASSKLDLETYAWK